MTTSARHPSEALVVANAPIMDALLQALRATPGVIAAVVCDRTGQVVASQAAATFEASSVDEVGRTVMASLRVVKNLRPDWESVTAYFSGGQLLICRLASHPSAPFVEKSLAVVAGPEFDNAAARAALAKTVEELKAVADEALPSAAPSRRSSSPEIVARSVAPGVDAELEEYLEDLARATKTKNALPDVR
jgi:hypothetical protein